MRITIAYSKIKKAKSSVQWFNGLFHPNITKSYNNKCNINHMREQMLDEDPAKREAWSAESSALIDTTGTLKLHII